MANSILLVEDDPILRSAYQILFTKKGYDVWLAEDGMEALEIIKKRDPDIILLDILLPKLNGFDFMRKYRDEEPEKPKAHIIVLTNLNSPETSLEASKLGALKTLFKANYSPEELANFVEAAVAELK